jgi:putative ATPase
MHLRDRHYKGADRLGHGEGYEYPHDAEGGWVQQDYLGVDKRYYEPVDRGHESVMKQRLEEIRQKRQITKQSGPDSAMKNDATRQNP